MMKLIGGHPEDPELFPMTHAAWVDTEPGKAEWKKGNNCPWCGAKMDLVEQIKAYECPDDNTVSILTFFGSKYE
jgi:hypothetical protein